jgi:hypothetical protein
LLEVANAFQKMPDGARKSAIALKLFGLEGAKLIPFLNEGAKGIQALEDEAAGSASCSVMTRSRLRRPSTHRLTI